MLRSAVVVLALLFAASIGAWRIVTIWLADRWAVEDPVRALHWIDRHPTALLALAETQLDEGKLEAARITARKLLGVEPLEGRGFRVLADVARQQGRSKEALALYKISERRSPRDLKTRARLLEHYLQAGEHAAAIAQMDVVIRIAPERKAKLLPLMAQLASEPEFAAKLAQALERRPEWRSEFLSHLLSARDPRAADSTLSSLRRAGGLTDAEFDEWIARLMQQGRWSEAYVRWVGTLDLREGKLPLVYNGGFEKPVTGKGFDWRTTKVAGVSIEFVPDGIAPGNSAHASFRWRQVPKVNVEQPLLLAPGRYRFSSRVRASALQSDRGLQWAIVCEGQTVPLAASERLSGTFGWRNVPMDVTIPATGCDGQWLRMLNPAPTGFAQQVSGNLWFDDVGIKPSPHSP